MITEALKIFKEISESMLREVFDFVEPYAQVLPDARFAASLRQLMVGLLAARTPHLSKAAARAPDQSTSCWARAKCFYRLMMTPRFTHRAWLKQMYADARAVVAAAGEQRIVVALDPVNFENPYARKLEGISRVRKSTPPGSLTDQPARITYGYPAIIAQVVNLPQLAIPYARLFSYQTEDFISENQELKRALRTIRTVLSGHCVCIVGDAGLDDQKFYAYAGQCDLEFIIRATHNRWVEVYNPRLDRWEKEKLKDLVATVPRAFSFRTSFTHAGRTRIVAITLDWLQIRIPGTEQILCLLVSEGGPSAEPLALITNRSVTNISQAKQALKDWRLRPTIEHLYRFLQEEGLDVEKIRLHKLERRRRELTLILVVALFVLRLPHLWSPAVLSWLRQLGSGIAGTSIDRHGPYLFLFGLQAVLIALAVSRSLLKLPIHTVQAFLLPPCTARPSYG
jgi:hypothetical protein